MRAKKVKKPKDLTVSIVIPEADVRNAVKTGEVDNLMIRYLSVAKDEIRTKIEKGYL